MFVSLHSVLEQTRELVGSLEPSSLEAAEAARALILFAELERLALAGRMRLAPRVEAARAVWQREGHRTFADWLAAKTGQPVGTAIASAKTAKRLEQLPATTEALCAGQLSEVKVREVAEGATADPSAEGQLLACARDGSVPALREAVRRTRAAAAPDDVARYRAIHESRSFRLWSESDGAVAFAGRMTPDAAGIVKAALEPRLNDIVRRATAHGRRESTEAHAADALVQLARDADAAGGSSRGSSPRATVHVRVDATALMRGHAEPGEVCEIPGLGEIPITTARAMLGDAILKVLVTDGVDVRTVVHAGRTVPAALRTALEERDQTCVVPGCDERENLQIDHWRQRYATGGILSIDSACRICWWHHYLKTYCGYYLWRDDDADDDWIWMTPDEQEGLTNEARPPPAA